MKRYFQYRKWKFGCFLVSDHADESQNCKNFRDVIITKDVGIILALGRKTFYEVYPIIRCQVDETQLMLPDYL